MPHCCPEHKKGSEKLSKAPRPPNKSEHTWLYVLAALAVGLLLFNQFEIAKMSSGSGLTGAAITTQVQNIIPAGTPKIYGSELKVSFDDVSPSTPQKADATIAVLANIDKTTTLSGRNLDRYITITSKISCEYCCGANSIIFDDGKPACGCAHSYAMRGLSKYLVTEHGAEYTDDEILEELGKWKTLFFPGQITAKADVLAEKGIELNYINLASNKYRGVEKGTAGSGMVGGC